MRRLPLLVAVLGYCWSDSALAGAPEVSPDDSRGRENRPCVACHAAIGQTFAATRMARSALGETFRSEWYGQRSPAACLSCHAPSGGSGLVCADCHGVGGHPYPKLQVPQVCARCHDAPGERTVQGFRASPAAAQGQTCLDCHLPEGRAASDHAFQGPSVPGFLDRVATLRLLLRQDPATGPVAVVQVTHRAGHALPGGTTGRSVWLIVSGLGSDGAPVWSERVRFGWEHPPDQGWRDRTLPAGRPAVLELPQPGRQGAERLRAELWYRFAPGDWSEPDPRARRLDAVELALPQDARALR